MSLISSSERTLRDGHAHVLSSASDTISSGLQEEKVINLLLQLIFTNHCDVNFCSGEHDSGLLGLLTLGKFRIRLVPELLHDSEDLFHPLNGGSLRVVSQRSSDPYALTGELT